MANRGKNKQLVQCWLTKINTAQHIGLAICTDRGGNIGREQKNTVLFVNKENVFLTSPVTELYVNYGIELQHTLN